MSGRHAAPEPAAPEPEARPVRHRRRRSRFPVVVVVAVVVLIAASAVTAVAVLTDDQEFVVAAWLPTWDDRGAESLPAALDEGGVTEIGPTWATVRDDGGLTLTPPPGEVVERVRAAGGVVLPVVQNYTDERWQGELVAALLADPDRAAAHRRALVETAVDQGWDGVDLDYESLPDAAREPLVRFLRALRDDLHEHDLVLAVTVPARTSDDEAGAYDYRGIGEVADQVRVMAYDHAWSGSPPGPIAPPEWVRAVVAYAADRIPPERLMLGVATYGYDWVDDQGVDLGAADAAALAREVGAEPRWDDDAAAMTFGYERDGRQHTVWYENARSLTVVQQIAVDAGLRGVALWRLGGEDPATWTTLGDAAGGDAR